jgi:hypothetical protein
LSLYASLIRSIQPDGHVPVRRAAMRAVRGETKAGDGQRK